MSWFGKYRATVTDNADPSNQGRIKVNCPKVMGKGSSTWALPCFPFASVNCGFIAVPNIGDTVWIEFEEGDAAKPIWVGNWLATGEMPSEVTAVDKVRIFKSESGQKVILNDSTQQVLIEDSSGSKVLLDAVSQTVTISAAKNMVITAANNITITSKGFVVNAQTINHTSTVSQVDASVVPITHTP